MKKLKPLMPAIVAALLVLNGCQSVGEHAAGTREAVGEGDRLTVGKVQREIRVGMSGAEVIQALGSPNVVTTDEKRREVWVYDKISTSRVESKTVGGVAFLAFIIDTASSEATSQRTLTVIVKFDDQEKVRDFAYHTSRF
ncbi:MAG: hypothetical protein ACE5JS_14215 [Nitrospinota bacterium]